MKPIPYLSYPSQLSIVGENEVFTQAVSLLMQAGVDAKCILDIYIKATIDPNREIRISPKAPGTLCVEQAQAVIAELGDRLKNLDPMIFIDQYLHRIKKIPNISGITDYIWQSVIATQHQVDLERILIVDAPIYLLSMSNPDNVQLVFAYSSPGISALLSANSVGIKRTICSLASLDGMFHRVLIFASDTPQVFRDTLTRVAKVCSQTTPIHLAAPNTLWDSAGDRSAILDLCQIQKIVLFDPVAVTGNPKKWCMTTLYLGRSGPTPDSIRISSLTLNKGHTALVGSDYVAVDYADFCSGKQTIKVLFNKSKADTVPRSKPEVIHFTEELRFSVNYSHCDGKVRMIAKLLQDAKHGEKGKLQPVQFSGPLRDSRQDAFVPLEELLFSSRDFAAKVRAAVYPVLYDKQVSLKTFWVLQYDRLCGQSKYDHALMTQIMTSTCDALATLSTDAKEDEVCQALKQFLETENQQQEVNILTQLNLLYLLAMEHLTYCNPVHNSLQTATRQKRDVNNLRSRLVDVTLSDADEQQLLASLAGDTSSPTLSLGVLLAVYTGISISLICALRWKDYICNAKREVTLRISRRIVGGNQGKDLDVPYLFPLPTVAGNLLLDHYLKKRKQADFSPDGYMFCQNNASQPITVSAMRHYLKEQMKHLRVHSQIIQIAGNKPRETDILDVHSYLLQHNFRNKCRCAGLTEDEIRHLSGRKGVTTAARHYTDYNDDFVQNNLRARLNLLGWGKSDHESKNNNLSDYRAE